MTIIQISALLGLLLAFGVDQPTVNRVQSILEAAPQKSAIIRVMDTTPKEEAPKEEEKKSSYDDQNVPKGVIYTNQ